MKEKRWSAGKLAEWIEKENDKVKVENKPYGPDSSKEEIACLRALVRKISDDIIYYKHPRIMTVFQSETCLNKVIELTADCDQFILLSDVSMTKRPGADVRISAKEWFTDKENKMKLIIIITGNNIILQMALKFIMPGIITTPFKICKTLEEAIRTIRQEPYHSL